jgi:hypothetical protein
MTRGHFYVTIGPEVPFLTYCCATMGSQVPLLEHIFWATMGTEVIAGTHSCATMTLNHISATMTYVMWREEHFVM